MDEYTANPLATEREAQRVLRKMNAEKAVSEADRARTAEKATEARDLARRFVTEGKSVFGGSGDLEKGMMGGRMKKPTYKAGGRVSASSRADGCAIKGKTKGRII